MRRLELGIVVLLATWIVMGASASAETKFDFEEIVIPGTPSLDNTRVDFTSPLTMTRGDITMTVWQENDVTFSVNYRSPVTHGAWGDQFDSQALSMFNGAQGSADPGAFIVNFSTPLSAVSVDMGDFGGGGNELFLTAFSELNAQGASLASDFDTLDSSGNFTFKTLTAAASGIVSLRMIGSTPPAWPNSVFYDNITVTAEESVPEPSTLALACCLGTAGVLVIRRRRRGAA